MDIDEEVFAQSVPEQVECVVDALAEASKANGMAEDWDKVQPKFKQHLDTWKQCSNADGRLSKALYVSDSKLKTPKIDFFTHRSLN